MAKVEHTHTHTHTLRRVAAFGDAILFRFLFQLRTCAFVADFPTVIIIKMKILIAITARRSPMLSHTSPPGASTLWLNTFPCVRVRARLSMCVCGVAFSSYNKHRHTGSHAHIRWFIDFTPCLDNICLLSGAPPTSCQAR